MRVRLLRPFWGHKTDTLGHIDSKGRLRLKGSPSAMLHPSDLGSLYEVL